ncbi:MAG: UDP-N-acetyl glucosamine 2-epimerase, partial [Nitrososphaerales archaeon]
MVKIIIEKVGCYQDGYQKMKIFMMAGIRPDFINLVLLVKELERVWGRESVIFCHSGQHYDYALDRIFFEQLGLRDPDYHLGIKGVHDSLSPTEQIGQLIIKSEPLLKKEKPDLAIAFSDGNPSMFGITANRLRIRLMHLEAGMRSNDYRMLEEKNRRIIDSISDYLFPPSDVAYKNLIDEGYNTEKIHLVGKIILDVIEHYMSKIDVAKLPPGLEPGRYFLAEFHRPENVDDEINLKTIMKFLSTVSKTYNLPVVMPAHPRTGRALERFNIRLDGMVKVLEPLGFFEFEKLQKNASAVITDSGTSQEVCCYHHIPCLVMRMSTERQECIDVGASEIC